MKKLIFALFGVLLTATTFAQTTPGIGNPVSYKTIKRGDTLDVVFKYDAAPSVDVRTFQVDFQYRKQLFTHVSTTVDATVSTMTPALSIKFFNDNKYSGYSSGTSTYSYVADTNYTVARNYLVLSSGSQITQDTFLIHNKFIINDVESNFNADSVEINWARMFKFDGTTIGDNVAVLNNQDMHLELLGNLVISGKVWLPPTMTGPGVRPTVICTKYNTGEFVSSQQVDTNGVYSLNNVDKNTKYKLEVRFPADSMTTIRDNAVTISDAVKTYDEYSVTDVNQNPTKTYLKHGLAYLIGDINKTGTLDGGDPYLIYANVSGLKKIDTTTMVHAFHRNVYDSLTLGANMWTEWQNHLTAYNYVVDSIGTTNLTNVDIKYFILGDVDRTHSSPVYNSSGVLVAAAVYKGNLEVDIPNVSSVGQPMFVPFNINTNGDKNYGLQFEMKYDKTKVKFEEIVSNFNGGPWLQYVTHDEAAGTIRFGGMNNQQKDGLVGSHTPFKIKFSAIGNNDISTNIFVRKLMDASDINGDHLNINLASQITTLNYKSAPIPMMGDKGEITARLWPNPTTGWMEVEVSFPESNINVDGSIYDREGRLIKNIGSFSSEGVLTDTKQVDMSTESYGHYYLVLNNKNKKLTKKFIKL
jgi:alkyl hydroperoxide reductase subunit AhpC